MAKRPPSEEIVQRRCTTSLFSNFRCTQPRGDHRKPTSCERKQSLRKWLDHLLVVALHVHAGFASCHVAMGSELSEASIPQDGQERSATEGGDISGAAVLVGPRLMQPFRKSWLPARTRFCSCRLRSLWWRLSDSPGTPPKKHVLSQKASHMQHCRNTPHRQINAQSVAGKDQADHIARQVPVQIALPHDNITQCFPGLDTPHAASPHVPASQHDVFARKSRLALDSAGVPDLPQDAGRLDVPDEQLRGSQPPGSAMGGRHRAAHRKSKAPAELSGSRRRKSKAGTSAAATMTSIALLLQRLHCARAMSPFDREQRRLGRRPGPQPRRADKRRRTTATGATGLGGDFAHDVNVMLRCVCVEANSSQQGGVQSRHGPCSAGNLLLLRCLSPGSRWYGRPRAMGGPNRAPAPPALHRILTAVATPRTGRCQDFRCSSASSACGRCDRRKYTDTRACSQACVSEHKNARMHACTNI